MLSIKRFLTVGCRENKYESLITGYNRKLDKSNKSFVHMDKYFFFVVVPLMFHATPTSELKRYIFSNLEAKKKAKCKKKRKNLLICVQKAPIKHFHENY